MDRTFSTTDPTLRRCWHPVARPTEVAEHPARFMLLGQAWVLSRAGGRIVAFADRCPHRRCPVSLGTSEAGVLQSTAEGTQR
jgi:vanillate O-demethylase monooxygenase subunit